MLLSSLLFDRSLSFGVCPQGRKLKDFFMRSQHATAAYFFRNMDSAVRVVGGRKHQRRRATFPGTQTREENFVIEYSKYMKQLAEVTGD